MIDKVCRNGLLYDFYGALLTDKQQYCFELHYLRDMSLSEIAGGLNVSRQAVHDILRRAEQLLEDYEDKLQLVSRYQKELKLLTELYADLDKLAGGYHGETDIRLIQTRLKELLDS